MWFCLVCGLVVLLVGLGFVCAYELWLVWAWVDLLSVVLGFDGAIFVFCCILGLTFVRVGLVCCALVIWCNMRFGFRGLCVVFWCLVVVCLVCGSWTMVVVFCFGLFGWVDWFAMIVV